MTPNRILTLNAASTIACAIVMLAARRVLAPLFGLESLFLLNVVAVGFLAYAAALALAAAARQPVGRQPLLVFAILDGAYVVASAVVLLVFWAQLAPLGRVLVIGVALVVEVFATLQFRAAGRSKDSRSPGAIAALR